MKKTARITLYVLSILTLLGMVLLIAFRGHGTKPVNVTSAVEETEELQTSAENQESGNISQDTELPNLVTDTENVAQSGTANDAGTAEETTLIFTGDVLFANSFKANYDAGGIDRIVSEDLLKELTEADILMVNNEFPFSTQGAPMEDKQYTFQCDPKYVSGLLEMGVDIVSLANNHTLDYGRTALSDTFTTLDQAEILYAGAGETAERAYELQVIEKNGVKFGFLAASRVIPEANWKVEVTAPGMLTAYDDTKLVELVKSAQSDCDFLTIYIHWGVEYDEYPQSYQTKIAADCFDAGANLIIGSHTHCLQGIEYIDGKPVFYSLGNFIFGQTVEKSAAVKVTVDADGNAGYQLLPVYASGGMTKLMEGTQATGLYSYMSQISNNLKIDDNGMISE